MHPGIAFSIIVDDLAVKVIYTSHFAERYSQARSKKPAPSERIGDELLQTKITEALPQIKDIILADPSIEGVIISRKTGMAIAFAARLTDAGGMTVAMKTILSSREFVPKSIRDYIVRINPSLEVRFLKVFSESMRLFVMDTLSDVFEELEDDASYHLRSEMVSYWVERNGNIFEIDEAEWLKDVYEIVIR